MLDTDAWNAICSILSTIDHSRRPDAQDGDAFGSLHVILFGDFKQPVDGAEFGAAPPNPQAMRVTHRQQAATRDFAPPVHRAPGCVPQLRLSYAPAEQAHSRGD